jgi:hypothetical protein
MHYKTIIESVLSTIALEKLLPNWFSDLTFPWLKSVGKWLKRLFIRTKQHYILWEHHSKHRGKLEACPQSPCDTLRIPAHDLGLKAPAGNLPVDKVV